MEEKFEKGDDVWVWELDPSKAVSQKFCADMRIPGKNMYHPFKTYDDKLDEYFWRNCSKTKPAAPAPANGTRIIGVDDRTGQAHRLYSAGRFDENGDLLCYVGGTDKWTSMGRMRGWSSWNSAEWSSDYPGTELK